MFPVRLRSRYPLLKARSASGALSKLATRFETFMPKRLLIFLAALLVAAAGCVRNQPEVIIITATFLPEPTPVALVPDQMPAPPIEQTLLSNEPHANQTPDPALLGAVISSRD